MDTTAICNQVVDDAYVSKFLDLWGRNSSLNISEKLGYDCVEGTDKDSINLLDFLNMVIQKKTGNLVRNWCNSCTTIQQTDQGYLTITGALDVGTSSSSTKPIYFKSGDVESMGSLKDAVLNIQDESWNNPDWPGIIVKTPKNKINKLDMEGNPLPSDFLKIETIPVTDASKITEVNGSNYSNYYYLFIRDSECSELPLPVYQNHQDTNVSNILDNEVWPLVSNDGTPLDINFSGCPDSCDWNWKKEENFISKR